jgi:two-component system response regulator DevR
MQSYGRRAITVYLLDDHDIVRRGLRDLMAVKRDIAVVGDSGSAEEAVRRIVELKPDVMVLDLQLQDGSGVQVCRAVRAVAPHVRGLLVTSAGDDEALEASVLAGASGYATKIVDSLTIIDDVRRVGAGQALIDPATAEKAGRRLLDRVDSGTVELPPGGRELLELMVSGRTDGEIAESNGRAVDDVSRQARAVLDAVTPTGSQVT